MGQGQSSSNNRSRRVIRPTSRYEIQRNNPLRRPNNNISTDSINSKRSNHEQQTINEDIQTSNPPTDEDNSSIDSIENNAITNIENNYTITTDEIVNNENQDPMIDPFGNMDNITSNLTESMNSSTNNSTEIMNIINNSTENMNISTNSLTENNNGVNLIEENNRSGVNEDSEGIPTTATAIMTMSEGATISPFSRMIAQMICEAVAISFRNGQMTSLTANSNVRQQLTIYLSSELFQEIEPESADDWFIRLFRLPVLVTATDERGVNSRIILLPVALYGISTPTITNEENNSRQWTIYIISGDNTSHLLGDDASYEELLNLATVIGQVQKPTISQEEIDNHLDVKSFSSAIKETIVGNSDKCQVCLNEYQLNEQIRVLTCFHAFHKDCLDQWLTQGQNKCPLCRKQAVPTATTSDE